MHDYEKKLKSLQENCIYLYYSSHVFFISTMYAFIRKKYDMCFISTSILITSLLRWGYMNNKNYTFIDRNWVKLIFFHFFYSLLVCCLHFKINTFQFCWLFGIMTTVVCLYIIEILLFLYSDLKITTALHMLIHFYTMIGFCIACSLNHHFIPRFRSKPFKKLRHYCNVVYYQKYRRTLKKNTTLLRFFVL